MNSRRRFLAACGALAALQATRPAWALLDADRAGSVMLDGPQTDRFRAWMTLIVAEQIRNGPSPRWYHRDCAGLARFAVAEALRPHDPHWRAANGLLGRPLPPEVELRPEQQVLRSGWRGLQDERQAFATALVMVQKNCRLLGREAALARPGDLLFYDQGDDQHLMIWMGGWIAYHTGQAPSPPEPKRAASRRNPQTQDQGLRAVTPAELLQWKDTRWRPRDDNPNFAGFFRLAFLSR